MSFCPQPALLHVSEEFIEELALGRPMCVGLTTGLRHISSCPVCLKRLDEERQIIDLVRMALTAEAGSTDERRRGLFLIHRKV